MTWARDECYGQPPLAAIDGSTTQADFSWQQYVEDTAKSFSDTGLLADGYQTMMLDDCWMASTRTSSGQLQPNSVWGWSSGQPGFTDMAGYGQCLHSLGAKFGIYETSGTATCQGDAGSWGHEATDAATFESWGVDEVKYDNRGVPSGYKALQGDEAMANGLKAAAGSTGDNILFDISEPAGMGDGSGKSASMDLVRTLGQQWRIGPDVDTYSTSNGTPVDHWNGPESGYSEGAYQEFDTAIDLARFQSPGNWNDADQLLIDDGMTSAEERSQMALFSMLSAPLIVSSDARKFEPAYINSPAGDGNSADAQMATHLTESVDILGNKSVIAVDQDRLGIGGYFVNGGAANSDGTPNGSSGVDIVAKPLSTGTDAVMYHCSSAPESITPQQAWSAPTGATIVQADKGTLAGGAAVSPCGVCSDGNLVGYIGNGGTLTTTVTVSTPGTYRLQVDYVDQDSGRTDDITVNGGTATPISFPAPVTAGTSASTVPRRPRTPSRATAVRPRHRASLRSR